ncbi:MAG TPA: DNA-3-methyladenine glycosylase I [Paracoccaceae bacterium]|nr:DNA-3-methyladenine glycosylase I [Paracoccaceae bacterium]
MSERCPWCGTDPVYVRYHDTEWGVPLRDPHALWENLVLEGFQAGLSWLTILRKRDTFRSAFAGFDPVAVAAFGPQDVARLLGDAGIVRHRGKIEGAIASARAFLALEEGDGFVPFVWGFVNGRPVQNRPATLSDLPGAPPVAVALSKALKVRGFAFCGPSITYAFMQASGLVNDHLVTCPRHAAVAAMA